MVIGNNNKTNGSFKDGWKYKIPRRQYYIQVKKFIDDENSSEKYHWVDHRDGTVRELRMPAGNRITYWDDDQNKIVTTSNDVFLAKLQLALNDFNDTFHDIFGNRDMGLQVKSTIEDFSQLKIENGNKVVLQLPKDSIALYTVRPQNTRLDGKKFSDYLLCGGAPLPRLGSGITLSSACDPWGKYCKNPTSTIDHEIDHNLGMRHAGQFTHEMGIRVPGITQSYTSWLEMRNSYAGLYDNPVDSPIEKRNFSIIKGRIDRKYFSPDGYTGHLDSFMCFMAIDDVIQMQSTVDVNGEFRFYVMNRDKNGHLLRDKTAKIIVLKLLDGHKRDQGNIESGLAMLMPNRTAKEDIDRMAGEMKIILKAIEVNKEVRGWFRKSTVYTDIDNMLDVLKLRAQDLLDYQIISRRARDVFLNRYNFMYAIKNVKITNQTISDDIEFDRITFNVNAFERETGIKLTR